MTGTASVAVWLIVGGALGTVLSALLSALLERSGHIRLRHWIELSPPGLTRLFERSRRFDAFRWLLALGSRLWPLPVFVGTWILLAPHGVARSVGSATVATAVLLLGAEWLNRYVVQVHAEAALNHLTPLYRLLHWLLFPLVVLIAPMVSFAQAEEEDDEDASEEEIDAFIDVGRREGILEPKEEELVRSIVDFGDTQARSVMTPRVEIQSAPADADYETLAARFFESKNSRLPLYEDSIDQIVGILHIRDLFAAVHAGLDTPPIELCKQPYYVPDAKDLPSLLAELQARHQQMAIVLDEYGGVAGLVTVEDLVEEIVGDIRDEHEPPEAPEPLADGKYRVVGRIHLEDVETLLAVDLESADQPYETLSGLICGELGEVPPPGHEVVLHGLAVEVEDADERRIHFARVSVAVDDKDAQRAPEVASL